MTLAALAVAGVGFALVMPHVAMLDEQPPLLAAAVWLAALTLRAIVALFVVVFLIVALPTTGMFEAISRWCWHTVVPLLATHLGFSGHDVADVAVLLPVAVLAVSATSVGFGIWRAARMVRRLVLEGMSGGPNDSVIIGDSAVVVAAAGLRHPRVVISAGALTTLEDDELFASLDHERGHILHRHRWLLVVAEICRALGRVVPGAHHAARELAFHLERDADRYALTCRHEPTALARAICKAAEATAWGAAATALNGGGVTRRVRQLLDGAPAQHPARSTRALLGIMVALNLGMLTALPAATVAATRQPDVAEAAAHCPH